MYIKSLLSSLLLSTTIVGAISIPRQLDESHLVLFGVDGRTEVVDKAEFMAKYHANHTTPLAPASLMNQTSHAELASDLEKRGCKVATVITEYPDSYFLNWDVPMSPVVKAGELTTIISVTEGYSIADTITVTETTTLTLVKNFLEQALSFSYAWTWTTSITDAFTFYINPHKFGYIRVNAWTHRKSGHVEIGCIGTATHRVNYQSDIYTSKSYDHLAWVAGVISLCTGDSYPVHNCLGNGYVH